MIAIPNTDLMDNCRPLDNIVPGLDHASQILYHDVFVFFLVAIGPFMEFHRIFVLVIVLVTLLVVVLVVLVMLIIALLVSMSVLLVVFVWPPCLSGCAVCLVVLVLVPLVLSL